MSKKGKREAKKKKLEWSKLVCGLIILYGVANGVLYNIAVFKGLQADPSLAIQSVITIIGAFVSYVLYNAALKISLNKNKLTVDQATGVVRSVVNGEFLDAVDSSLDE